MRKLFSLLVVLMLTVVIAACGDTNNENQEVEDNQNNQQNEEQGNEQNDGNANESNEGEQVAENGDEGNALEGFEDFFNHLEAEGLEVDTDAAEAQAAGVTDSVGADKGILIPIDGIEAQFYLFDTEDNEQYEEAENEGTITIDVGGEEFAIPYFVHDGIGFANPDDHYKGEEIVEYLEQF